MSQIRHWFQPHATYGKVHFSSHDHDYVMNVERKLQELDKLCGPHYRLKIDMLVGCLEENRLFTEIDTRAHCVDQGIEHLQYAVTGSMVARMNWTEEDGKKHRHILGPYSGQIPAFIHTELEECPGPFELEFRQRLAYLSTWGCHDNPERQTRVHIWPDTSFQSTMNFGFRIEEELVNEVMEEGRTVTRLTRKPILYGGLIYHGPSVDPISRPELDNYMRKWPQAWGVHT